MTIAIFLTYQNQDMSSVDLAAWFCNVPLAVLKGKRDVATVDYFQPSKGDVAMFGSEQAPPLLVQIDAKDPRAANEILTDTAFANVVVGGDHAALVDVFATRHYPVDGEAAPSARSAPLSFVVRYYRPVDDEQSFITQYINSHPAVLGRFPAVRNVLCYVPVAFDNPHGFTSTDAFIGNEVVFDDLDALNAALRSDVTPTLIDHARQFPKCRASHVPMIRRQVHG